MCRVCWNSAAASGGPVRRSLGLRRLFNDETSAIAEHYRAHVVRGDINRGCSHGKNVLATRTTADWIHFHDADVKLFSISLLSRAGGLRRTGGRSAIRL